MATKLELLALERLTKELKDTAKTIDINEAKFLVRLYYQIQDFRKSTANQARSLLSEEDMEEGKEKPTLLLDFFEQQFVTIEKGIKNSLDSFSSSSRLGSWSREHYGIGPVIAAGLLAYVDVTKAPYASSVWRYAGLGPEQRRKKGEKIDWNPDLKVLSFKIGESFIKFQNQDDCYYGHLFAQRKKREEDRNAMGGNKEAAEEYLSRNKYKEGTTKAAYERGELPPAHIIARARRFAVKRFLVHYWEAAFRVEYGRKKKIPNPYVQEILGHTHIDPCPIPLP